MRQHNDCITIGLGFLLAFLSKLADSLTTFSVIDGFSVKHTPGEQPIINYNHTKYHLALKKCHSVMSNFSVDVVGGTHSAYLPEFALSKAQDLFSWNENSLAAVFNNTLNTATLSSKCLLRSLANSTTQLLTCDNSNNDLAVVYGSSFEFRSGLIGFSNPGTLAECLNGFDGFLVAGYQRNASLTTASPSSTSSLSPSTLSPTPTVNNNDSSTLVWPYIVGAAVLMLMTGLCVAYRKPIKQSLQNGNSQLFCRGCPNKEKIPLESDSNIEQSPNYNFIRFNNDII